MGYFRFSCDTNVLLSSALYYRFSWGHVLKENKSYDLSIAIIRFFERVYWRIGLKFGILSQSVWKEVQSRKKAIIIKKIKEFCGRDKNLYITALNELSILMNRFDRNLKRNLKVFEIGKAYASSKRVRKIYDRVSNMYKNFNTLIQTLDNTIRLNVENHAKAFYSPRFLKDNKIIEEDYQREKAYNQQIFRLTNKPIYDTDLKILSEIIYERKRFLQENHKFRDDFTFYFITEDTHLSPKYIKRYKFYSDQITKEIENLFQINCIRANQFIDLTRKKRLNMNQ